MKRAIMLILVTFLLVGCMTNKVSSSNEGIQNNNEPVSESTLKKQQYSFGPMADLSRIDDATKQELQNHLDKLGDPPTNRITFNGISAFYNEDGSLLVDIFIRNGYSYSVFNLEATLDIIKDGKIIASAPFYFNVQEFGELPSNVSRPWTILYYPEDIKFKENQLSEFDINVNNLQYEY
ncbi:SLAP domain-containing protein [Clostridium sp.]|jgi:SLAP domain-containing protein|uniref:SLAP domain-containing protein n=1 Tax=Clostridium sp. TaxID=1506 RepID=UPI0039F54D0B